MDPNSCLLDNYKQVFNLLNCNRLLIHKHHHKDFCIYRKHKLVDQLDNLCLQCILDDILSMGYQ